MLHDGHTRLVLDGLLVGVQYSRDLGALPDHLVEDVDLVIDGDTRVLTQALDTVRDFATKTRALERRCQFRVEHHSSGALGLAAPLSVGLDLSAELFHNLKHTSGHFVAIDVNATLTQVRLDLIVR